MTQTAILLPGLDGTGELFAPFLAVAPADVECVVVRYPPDRALNDHDLEACVLARVPSDRPLMLVAESFSGAVAVRVAARLGDRVTKLVLCNSFLTPPRPSFLRHFAIAPLFRVPFPERVIATLMLAPFATPALASQFRAALRRAQPAVLAHRLRQVLTIDELATLHRVTAPVIYLRGTRDRLVPRRAVEQLHRALPAMRIHEIDGPHALLQTKPEACWSSIYTAGLT